MIVTPHVTNGGAHPPEFYAQHAVDQFVSIAPTASGQSAEEGQKYKDLAKAYLATKFGEIQSLERKQLQVNGEWHVKTPLVDHGEVLKLVNGVSELAQGSIHELHFKQDHVKMFISNVIGHHIATLRDVERKWHNNGT